MSRKLTVEELQPHDWEVWARLVADSPDGSIYATPKYLDVLCSAAGGSFRILGLRQGDELIGGLPLYETTSPAGQLVGPRLLLYYLGPVLRRSDSKYPSQRTARSVETMGQLIDAVESGGYARVTLKGRHSITDVRPFLARGWKAWPSYSYLVSLLDLTDQWGKVEQNLRRLVQRCTAEGMTVSDDDRFDEFLALHASTMNHYGVETYLPAAQFRQWFTRLRSLGHCRLYQARLPNGQSIAAQLVLVGGHPVSHTVSAATDPDHRRLGAAAFLRWRVFEELARLGSVANDLTDAALNQVTHFKSQLGGELVTNIVVETAGTWRWRASRFAQRMYGDVRGMAGAALRRLHGGPRA